MFIFIWFLKRGLIWYVDDCKGKYIPVDDLMVEINKSIHLVEVIETSSSGHLRKVYFTIITIQTTQSKIHLEGCSRVVPCVITIEIHRKCKENIMIIN